MPDGLYDSDALAWSEHQAELLRRLAKGERLNEAVDWVAVDWVAVDWVAVDWVNVIDEVEAAGRSELRACESQLRQPQKLSEICPYNLEELLVGDLAVLLAKLA